MARPGCECSEQRVFPVVVHVAYVLFFHCRPRDSRTATCQNIRSWDNPISGVLGSRFLTGGLSLSSVNPDLYSTALAGLIAARKAAALTQIELAKTLGRPQSFVSKYEAGERRLDVAEYLAISRAIGADPYKLLKRAEAST
jgi:hypothetical protein